jgi:hypothetical protein
MDMRRAGWEITTTPNIKEARTVSSREQVIHVPATGADHYSIDIVATIEVGAVNAI